VTTNYRLLVFHACVDFGILSKIKAKKCLKIKKAHYHLVICRKLEQIYSLYKFKLMRQGVMVR
jgi:hypothetical protein